MIKNILIGAAALGMSAAVPLSAFAQTYAYVNMSGDVTTMDAVDATTALNTAPNIATHSGVLLLTTPSDAVVGDSVSGI